jgi:hypothetical protein
MTRERSEPIPEWGILVGSDRAVVGFRYPSAGDDPGEGDNFVRANEIRAASRCLVVIGDLGPHQWSSPSRASVEYIAQQMAGYCITGITVSPVHPMPEAGRTHSRKRSRRTVA